MKLYNVNVHLRDGSIIRVNNVKTASATDDVEYYDKAGGGRTSVYKEHIVYIVSEVI